MELDAREAVEAVVSRQRLSIDFTLKLSVQSASDKNKGCVSWENISYCVAYVLTDLNACKNWGVWRG